MLETHIPQINVDDIMQYVRKEVEQLAQSPDSYTRSTIYAETVSAQSQITSFILPASKKYDFSELLTFHNLDFIANGYAAILRRVPDLKGRDYYLSRLQDGTLSKAEILGRMRFSKEGRSHKIKVSGLFFPFIVQSSFKIPLLGRFLRIIVGIFNLPQILRNIQKLEQTLLRANDRMNNRLKILLLVNSNLERRFATSVEDLQRDYQGVKLDVERVSAYEAANRRKLCAIEQFSVGNLRESNAIHSGQSSGSATAKDSSDGLYSFPESLYVAFENTFRGPKSVIKDQQAMYLPYVKEALAQTGKKKILDIGCGRGEWLELLQENGYDGCGVDQNGISISENAVSGLNVECIDGLEYLALQVDDSFAFISGFHFVEHLPFSKLLILIDECLRVLACNGILLFETPNPENLIVGACNFYTDPTHCHPLPHPTLKFLLEERGGRDVEVILCNPNENRELGSAELQNLLYGPQDYAILCKK